MQLTVLLLCVVLCHQATGLLLQSNLRSVNKVVARSNRSTFISMSTESDMEGKRGMKGYYRRPSRAAQISLALVDVPVPVTGMLKPIE